MVTTIIDKIKTAEEKAEELVSKANQKAHQITVGARLNADDILHKRLKEASIKADVFSASIIKSAFKEANGIIRQAQEVISDIKGKAYKNLDAAKDVILDQIKKYYGCS